VQPSNKAVCTKGIKPQIKPINVPIIGGLIASLAVAQTVFHNGGLVGSAAACTPPSGMRSTVRAVGGGTVADVGPEAVAGINAGYLCW
jgi:hypothetical protein